MDTTPEQVLSIMGVTTNESAIIFTTKDLSPEGGDHNKALYVTIYCIGSKVPKVLVDNGFSINVCPMRTGTKIGLTIEQLAPSSLMVRAYNESSRRVVGTFEAKCQLGSVSSSVLFHVLEITTSYNLLLGRAWMYPLGIVPSMVHQKLKLPWKGGVLTILSDGEISAPVCDIKSNNDIQLQGFEVMKTSSVVIASIMKKMGYQSGMGLGKFSTKELRISLKSTIKVPSASMA